MRVATCVAVAFALGVPSAHAQSAAASLGRQRAATSPMQWQAGDAKHPVLGQIRFAYLKNVVQTPVGAQKVYSRAYVSCQKSSGKLAIELTHVSSPDDAGGMPPASMPRLTCQRADGPKLVQADLKASWTTNKIGDALAQGFAASALRECVAIHVVQEVALPAGWAKKTARVELDIEPYNREVDSVFATCGETSAYATAAAASSTALAAAPPAASAPPATSAPPTQAGMPMTAPTATAPSLPPPQKPQPAPAPATPAHVAPAPAAPAAAAIPAGWHTARTITSGRTNVRAGPSVEAKVVTQMPAGAVILVQKASGDWWRVKPTRGPPFEGYIREDRLDLR